MKRILKDIHMHTQVSYCILIEIMKSSFLIVVLDLLVICSTNSPPVYGYHVKCTIEEDHVFYTKFVFFCNTIKDQITIYYSVNGIHNV